MEGPEFHAPIPSTGQQECKESMRWVSTASNNIVGPFMDSAGKGLVEKDGLVKDVGEDTDLECLSRDLIQASSLARVFMHFG